MPRSIGDQLAVGVARVFQHHREQRQIVIGQHQRRQLIGKRHEARRRSVAFLQNRRGKNEADRPIRAQQRYGIGGYRLALGHRPRQHRRQHGLTVKGTARKDHGPRVAGFDVHHHIDRSVERTRIQRLVVIIADRRIRKSGARQFAARRIQFVRLQPRDPACDDEIGLEGVDRGPQRLQHVGLDHRRRAEQARCDAGEQFALGQPVLDQAGVNVDRARQRDAVDGQFLIVDAIGRKTGEQNSDQRDKTDDETQPNHSLTRKMRSWRRNISAVRRGGNKPKQDESQPSGI